MAGGHTIHSQPSQILLLPQQTRSAVTRSIPVLPDSRPSLRYSRYTYRLGTQATVIRADVPFGVPLGETFLAENMRDAGYATAIFGKWHLGFYQVRRGIRQYLGDDAVGIGSSGGGSAGRGSNGGSGNISGFKGDSIGSGGGGTSGGSIRLYHSGRGRTLIFLPVPTLSLARILHACTLHTHSLCRVCKLALARVHPA